MDVLLLLDRYPAIALFSIELLTQLEEFVGIFQ